MKPSIVEIVVPLTLGLALVAAPPAVGDRVSGVVRDGAYEELVPVRAASVLCRPEATPERPVETHTDGKGAFACDEVATGVVAVEYRKLGYVPKDDVKRVEVAGAAEVELRLYQVEPESDIYWAKVAGRVLELDDTDYVDAIERLAEIGLGSRSLGLVADRVARSLPTDQAALFEEQVAALDIPLEHPRLDPDPDPGGPPTAVLAGRVVMGDGTSLPGVTITLSSPALQGVRVATTNADGSYAVRALPPGRYQVIAELEGFASVSSEVEVRVGGTASLDIEVPLETNSIEGIMQ